MPIKTAEAFEAVNWLADLPPTNMETQAGRRKSDIILTKIMIKW